MCDRVGEGRQICTHPSTALIAHNAALIFAGILLLLCKAAEKMPSSGGIGIVLSIALGSFP